MQIHSCHHLKSFPKEILSCLALLNDRWWCVVCPHSATYTDKVNLVLFIEIIRVHTIECVQDIAITVSYSSFSVIQSDLATLACCQAAATTASTAQNFQLALTALQSCYMG